MNLKHWTNLGLMLFPLHFSLESAAMNSFPPCKENFTLSPKTEMSAHPWVFHSSESLVQAYPDINIETSLCASAKIANEYFEARIEQNAHEVFYNLRFSGYLKEGYLYHYAIFWELDRDAWDDCAESIVIGYDQPKVLSVETRGCIRDSH